LADLPASPALSQVGGSWPADGRTVGIVVDDGTDAEDVADLIAAISSEGLVPLVVGPHAGTLANGIAVQRTFAAGRSVELDAVLVGARPGPAPDAQPSVDAKGGEPTQSTIDPRVVLLLHEAFRHAKAIGSWGSGMEAVADAGIPFGAAGLVADENAREVWPRLHELMTQHRAWERFAGDPDQAREEHARR
jgi:catalase